MMLAISTAVLSFMFLYLRYHARGGAFGAFVAFVCNNNEK